MIPKLEQIVLSNIKRDGINQKRKRPGMGRFNLKQFPGNYFGAGVVVPPELFLLFLPPFLPCDFVLVAFLPLAGLVTGALSPEVPPPVCANDRLAPSNIANTNVASFFIPFSPLKENSGFFMTRARETSSACPANPVFLALIRYQPRHSGNRKEYPAW